jgi:hypothetical protein
MGISSLVETFIGAFVNAFQGFCFTAQLICYRVFEVMLGNGRGHNNIREQASYQGQNQTDCQNQCWDS